MSRLLTPRRARVAGQIGFGLHALAGAFLVGRDIAVRVAGAAALAPSKSAATTALTNPRPSTAAAAITATPSVIVTPAPASSPLPTPDPLVVTAYQDDGRRFAALVAPAGYTLTSPVAGTGSVVIDQFLGGDMRVGSNIPRNGASSWRTCYDRSVSAQVKASVGAVPSGAELDPVPLLKR